LNIALDATYSIGHDLTGVGVYSRELIRGLCRMRSDDRFLLCYRAHRLRAALYEDPPANASRAWLRSGGFWPFKARLFHGLNQRVDRVRAPRIVSTFHDLFVITGDYSTAEFRIRFAAQARTAAERSSLIITVSEFTADQVVNALGVERSRVRVVHHGVHMPDGAPASEQERENIILHVGAIQRRKNLFRLVEAFERTPAEWRLVLVGGQGFGAPEILRRIASSPRRDDIDVTGYAGAEKLESLYQRARIFAFPSLDEGFGMPILDAMARGVPVLTSNRSATREVAADAALLIDPNDTDSVASGLVRIASNPALRAQLREAGLARVKNFSWEKAVARTWQVYRELLS
jgi:glycosyltransferase involved in cell wall biosynthesis